MITEKEDFNYARASKIDMRDGCVKCIWLEESKTTKLDKENSVSLRDGYNALLEFENGKKMITTNSEWASLNWLLRTNVWCVACIRDKLYRYKQN